MTFITILTEPAILIIVLVFLCFIFITLRNYIKVKSNLKKISDTLKNIDKKEISYKFKQLDSYMSSNSYTSVVWEDFKKALIFPDKFYLAQNIKTSAEPQTDIFLTIDAPYFFNEETLVSSKINHKFIQTMPTILTGLGPFFTFLKMAIAFKEVSFENNINVTSSINGLIANIQIAALCSVFAVGFSLLFMFVEKILYNRMCKNYYLLIQQEFVRLFDVVTSEKFLIDLLKESRMQNNANEKILKTLPETFANSITTCFGETVVPYLDNILYGLNKLNENFDKGSGSDVVDKLF
jgi:hypothetical protein